MTRAALVCLILLTACRAKDPAGTLTPSVNKYYSNQPSIVLKELDRGDSVPIKLLEGDQRFIISSPKGMDSDTAWNCSLKIQLIPYGQQSGQLIYDSTHIPVFETRRLNAVSGGVYYLRVDAAYNYCTPTIIVDSL